MGKLQLDTNNERRREQRLHYHWPIWFAEDFNEILSQGQMVDISSRGVAFTCHADGSCPYLSQRITTRFSVPRFGPGDSFDMASFTRTGHICRVDNINNFLHRVAVQFAEPLPFRPGEQTSGKSESDVQNRLKAITT